MKGYRPPRTFEIGICFLCRKPHESPQGLVHLACAVAYAEEKDRRIKEADAQAREEKDDKQRNEATNNTTPSASSFS